MQIIQEEKGVLVSLERCLKEKCSELQEEVQSLKSGMSQKGSTCLQDKKGNKGLLIKRFISTKSSIIFYIYLISISDGSTPEDEGISSSERSLTPEDDQQQRHPSVYDLYGMHCKSAIDATKPPVEDDEDETETTIDEVIEELQNIVNNVESEALMKEKLKKAEERKRTEEAQVASKLHIRIDVDDYAITNENEIIPCNLHPQPPRRARSLVHLFLPMEEYDYCNKELFFENETAFTSEEGSDSLLSGSKFYQLQPKPDSKIQGEEGSKPRPSSRSNLKRCESFKYIHKQTSAPKPTSRNSFDYSRHFDDHNSSSGLAQAKTKCKSLDRINEGLNSFVNVTVNNKIKDNASKSDSGNVSGVSLTRTYNILMGSKEKNISRLSLNSEEKQRMFLPSVTDHNDIPYYFPRIQEKRSSTSSSFLIRRGHGNAGLYSGQIVISNQHSYLIKKRDSVQTDKNCSVGKVTDLPSGLY